MPVRSELLPPRLDSVRLAAGSQQHCNGPASASSSRLLRPATFCVAVLLQTLILYLLFWDLFPAQQQPPLSPPIPLPTHSPHHRKPSERPHKQELGSSRVQEHSPSGHNEGRVVAVFERTTLPVVATTKIDIHVADEEEANDPPDATFEESGEEEIIRCSEIASVKRFNQAVVEGKLLPTEAGSNQSTGVRGHGVGGTSPHWGRTLIVTTWFKVGERTKFAEKLQKQSARGDELQYIKHWHTTIRILGMDAVVLHNGWMNQTVRRMFATEHIAVWQIDINSCCPSSPCQLTLLDWRWLVYLRTLQRFDQAEFIILSDGRDVAFHMNPFPFMRQMHLERGIGLFMGSEYCPLSELGEIQLPYKLCYNGYADGTSPFAYNAGVVAGTREALLFLVHHIVHEVLTMVIHTAGAKDCDMAVMNHVLHTQIIPRSKYRIFTGLPLLKDPIIRRSFRQGVFQGGVSLRLSYNPERFTSTLGLTDKNSKSKKPKKHTWRVDIAATSEDKTDRSPQTLIDRLPTDLLDAAEVTQEAKCENCTKLVDGLVRQFHSRAWGNIWRSPKWAPPPHCVMVTFVANDSLPWYTGLAKVNPKWGALVVFHEGILDEFRDNFTKAAVKLIRIDRQTLCPRCTKEELALFLILAYVVHEVDITYVVWLDQITWINTVHSACDFIKRTRHYKFLWHIILFVGSLTSPLQYVPPLQHAYDSCYSAQIDGPSSFVYEPVVLAGMTPNVINALRLTLCELLCHLNLNPNLTTSEGLFHPSECIWPAFNHAVHLEKDHGQVWSAALPIYNNQRSQWNEETDTFYVEHKWSDDGPTLPTAEFSQANDDN